MALSGINRGTGVNNTASTSLTVTIGTAFTVGSLALLTVSYDNTGVQGSDPFSSISDTNGNSWTTAGNTLIDPGAAAAGVACRIFATRVTALNVGNLVTVVFNTSTTAKAYTLTEISSNDPLGSVFVSSPGLTAASASGATQTGTLSHSSMQTGNIVFAVLSQEGNGTRTGDADTLNGTWSTAQATGVGATTSGVELITQFKLLTASGNQVYNPVATPLGDWTIMFITLTEAISGSFDPFGTLGFFGM